MADQSEMLQKIEEFFCSPKFTSAIGDFLSTNTSELEFKPIDEEQPLKNFDIFKQYTTLIEQQLEEFIRSEGLTVKSVCEACASAQETHSHMAAIDYLVASTEYESFMQLAYDHFSMGQYEPEEGEEWAPEPEDGQEGEA